MMDALEALLEEEEQEGEELPALFPQGGIRRKQKQEEEAPWPKEARAEGGVEDDAGSHTGLSEKETAHLARKQEGRERAEGVARLTDLPLAGGWKRGSAIARELSFEPTLWGGEEALYESMKRTRQAAGYRREPSGGWIPLEKGTAGEARSYGLDAAALDKLVGRDARRYDGGFTWQ